MRFFCRSGTSSQVCVSTASEKESVELLRQNKSLWLIDKWAQHLREKDSVWNKENGTEGFITGIYSRDLTLRPWWPGIHCRSLLSLQILGYLPKRLKTIDPCYRQSLWRLYQLPARHSKHDLSITSMPFPSKQDQVSLFSWIVKAPCYERRYCPNSPKSCSQNPVGRGSPSMSEELYVLPCCLRLISTRCPTSKSSAAPFPLCLWAAKHKLFFF